ncbi:FAD-dependent oxidoreductase [Streptomyces sp. NPDC048434]|uniref:FAD-dependent oxidoreductase n=1 Tax=Streptomyces sp. NPDC048434 TaxID=3365549 RepID=UPI003714E5C0
MTRTATVVGAGVFGLSVARELARRGWRVEIVAATAPGAYGPSAGDTRILRCAYGDDLWYADLAHRARRRWRGLERETGERFLLPVGVLSLGADSAFQVLDGLGVPAETVRPAEAASRFGLHFADVSGPLLYEPQGAVLRAAAAVGALALSVRAHGAHLTSGTAVPDGEGRAVVDGRTRRTRLTVWAAGAALTTLFPAVAAECGLRTVRQDCWYVAAPAATGPRTAWIDQDDGCYGIPAVSAKGIKVVPDVETPWDAPDHPDEGPLPARVHAHLRHRLPGLDRAPLTRRERCHYTTTSDAHFLLTRPGATTPAVWLVGGDSGHGFKHGPAWGEFVCDVMEERTELPVRFGPRRMAAEVR